MPSSSSTSSNSCKTSSRRNGTNWRTTAFAVLVVFLAFSLRVTGTLSSLSFLAYCCLVDDPLHGTDCH
jgi:hypothetical protein